MGQLRGQPPSALKPSFERLGFIKYTLATMAALLTGTAAAAVGAWWLCPLAVVAFYIVEVQMVFLFPVALDGGRQPFATAHDHLRRAGGTRQAVPIVMRIACHMLLGGFRNGAFLQCWCEGCLAVCVWYELVRARPLPTPGRVRLQWGNAEPLQVRHEAVNLPNRFPSAEPCLRLLYASDLHLGRCWTRHVAGELLAAARSCRPDAILLGGDMVDCRGGLRPLTRLVAQLVHIAPVLAVPGNHDLRVGQRPVRSAVTVGGGLWLPDGGVMLRERYWLSAPRADPPPHFGFPFAHIRCGHDPADPIAGEEQVNIILAGHLHGGQCVLSERDGRLWPGCWINRWTGLRFDLTTLGLPSTMIVSRGAADTLPIRWNCPRELILCTVRG